MNINIQANVKDWQVWLKNGDQYFKAAVPENRKSRFNTSLRYNLLSMSLEGYTMAICDFHNVLPVNHTYTDLMETLEEVIPIEPDFKTGILKFESIQDICSIENYRRSHPEEDELEELASLIARLSETAHKICDKKAM